MYISKCFNYNAFILENLERKCLFLFLIDLGEPSLPSPNLGFIQDPGEFPAVGSFVSDNLKALLVI